MKFKKSISILLITVMVLVLVVGCGKKAETPSATPTAAPTAAAPGKPIEITFWHAMGGVNGKAIDTMVESFNKSRTDIHLTAQFQGTYDEALTKLKTSMQGKSGPDIVQVFDIGTRFMIDSGWIAPMQDLIDADKSVDINSFEPNLLGYYTINKKLYSMPFNSSTPILYYNKTAFKEAGLDPNVAPKSFKEVEEFSKKLVKKDASGKVTQYGYSMAVYGWFFEQLLAKQGQVYANNGNGRTEKATAVAWDKGDGRTAALNVLNEWKKLVDSGNVGNFGRKTDDTKNAFIAGRTAIMIESTGALPGLLSGVGTRFEMGTGFLPSITDGDKGGVMIGGGSLWMIENGDAARKKAAFEVIKYFVSPEQQVFWNSQSGYFPVTKKAYDLPAMNEQLKKIPLFKTAIDQLHATKLTEVTSGGLVGVFAQARATIEIEIEKMLQKTQTPEQTLDAAAKSINTAIENYNKTTK